MKKLTALVVCFYLCGCVSNSKFQEELILHHNWEDRAKALAAELQETKGRYKYETTAMWQIIGSLRTDSSQMENYIRHLENKGPNNSAALLKDLNRLEFINDSLQRVIAQLRAQPALPSSLPPAIEPVVSNEPVVSKDPIVNEQPSIQMEPSSLAKQMNKLEKFVVQKMANLPSGKAYVKKEDTQLFINLSDQLIFESGDYKVESKGISALSMLASVIKEFPDFTVLVVGHTDNIPIRRKGIRDNWDLSVLRASSIVRSLVRDYNFDPTRIIAAGHGEFDPITTEESEYANSKNRRIEIILTHTSMLGHASL